MPIIMPIIIPAQGSSQSTLSSIETKCELALKADIPMTDQEIHYCSVVDEEFHHENLVYGGIISVAFMATVIFFVVIFRGLR